MSYRTIGLAALAGLLAGCTTLPEFNGPPGSSLFTGGPGRAPTPTVDAVIQHIQCEIYNLPRPDPARPKGPFDALWANQYVAYAILTIDVTDNGGVSPSFDFIQPLSAASTSRSLTLAPSFGSVAHREITQTFVLDLDPSDNPSPTFNPGLGPDGHVATLKQYCKTGEASGLGIKGDLGLKEVIEEGLRHADSSQFVFPLVDTADNLGNLGLATSSLAPSFTSTIDFTLTYGLNGSPNWTLTHFTGPTGGSAAPLSYLRTRKDTLLVAFAAAQRRPLDQNGHFAVATTDKEIADKELGAARAAALAKDGATFTLLQHLLPISP